MYLRWRPADTCKKSASVAKETQQSADWPWLGRISQRAASCLSAVGGCTSCRPTQKCSRALNGCRNLLGQHSGRNNRPTSLTTPSSLAKISVFPFSTACTLCQVPFVLDARTWRRGLWLLLTRAKYTSGKNEKQWTNRRLYSVNRYTLSAAGQARLWCDTKNGRSINPPTESFSPTYFEMGAIDVCKDPHVVRRPQSVVLMIVHIDTDNVEATSFQYPPVVRLYRDFCAQTESFMTMKCDKHQSRTTTKTIELRKTAAPADCCRSKNDTTVEVERAGSLPFGITRTAALRLLLHSSIIPQARGTGHTFRVTTLGAAHNSRARFLSNRRRLIWGESDEDDEFRNPERHLLR